MASAVSVEDYTRKYDNRILRHLVTIHYEEFLNHAKLSSEFNVKTAENLVALN